jgi:hypothetical protein
MKIQLYECAGKIREDIIAVNVLGVQFSYRRTDSWYYRFSCGDSTAGLRCMNEC